MALEVLTKTPRDQLAGWLDKYGSIVQDQDRGVVDQVVAQAQMGVRLDGYLPKCRVTRPRSDRQQVPGGRETVFECTNGCRQGFNRKGDWARHERANIEEWMCLICHSTLSRKEKLREHLRNLHDDPDVDLEQSRRQLLAPRERPCGFCLQIFDEWEEWLCHVSAHFEGLLPGGVKTMGNWSSTSPSRGSENSLSSNDVDPNNYRDEINYEAYVSFPDFGPTFVSGGSSHLSQDSFKEGSATTDGSTSVDQSSRGKLSPIVSHSASNTNATSFDSSAIKKQSFVTAARGTQLPPSSATFGIEEKHDLLPAMASLTLSGPNTVGPADNVITAPRSTQLPPASAALAIEKCDLLPAMASLTLSGPTHVGPADDDTATWSEYSCGCAECMRMLQTAGLPVEVLPGSGTHKRCRQKSNRYQLERFENQRPEEDVWIAGYRDYSMLSRRWLLTVTRALL